MDFFGGGTHSSNGYLPNGATAYANTYLLPSTSLSQNSTHISYYANSDSNLGIDMGSRYETGDSAILSLYIREGNISYSRLNNVGSEFTVTNNTGTGMYVLSRIESNTYNYYKNNIKSVATKTSSGLPTRSVTIGGLSINNIWSYGNKRCAFASIGDGLTDTEAANFSTAVQTFQTTLGRHVGVPIVADADAQAFLNAAVITDQTQANAVTTLVTDLKSANIWSKMKAIYPFVGGSASSHKFNLKDPRDLNAAFRLTFNGGMTHSSNGILFGGSNGYAETYLTPSLSLSQNNKHVSVYVKNTSNNFNNTLIGAGNGSTFDQLVFANSAFFGNLSSNFSFNYIGSTNGLYVVRRISSTGTETFKNNSLFFADNQTSNGNTNVSYSIGRRNYNGGDFYGNNTISFTSIGDGLTNTEAAAFYTAVQKYQTTLGRQV